VVTNQAKGDVINMDSNLVITLLTIIVSLLSAVIIGLLIVVIVVLVKIRRMTNKLNHVLANAAKATDWLSPTKLFYEARRAFHK
jgi:MFS superfamily sulfate permease-like transporter